MAELPNWNRYLVVQRDPQLGCIPTGYEWMLRIAEIPDINFEMFQDEFNLQARGIGVNSFVPIAQEVTKKYPDVKIESKHFEKGIEKIEYVTDLVKQGSPCLLSLTLDPQGNCHIMPIIYIDGNVIRTIWRVMLGGIVLLCEYQLWDILFRHENWAGGKDIAWLEL